MSRQNLQGMTVLVVDDDPDTIEVLTLLLQGHGAHVLRAESAASGLELLKHRPHVILSDLNMPGQDGFEFIRSVRARPAELGGTIPAAALTGIGDAAEARALDAGYQAFLSKPTMGGKIIDVLRRLAFPSS
jgi:CheY-like chemotaxis protein